MPSVITAPPVATLFGDTGDTGNAINPLATPAAAVAVVVADNSLLTDIDSQRLYSCRFCSAGGRTTAAGAVDDDGDGGPIREVAKVIGA